MIIRQFAAMVKARTMEFVRDRGTFFWNLFFPVMIVAGFAIGFSNTDPAVFKVGIVGSSPSLPAIMQVPEVKQLPYRPEAGLAAREDLRRHKIDLVLDTTSGEWLVNRESKNGRFLASAWEQSLTGSGYGRSEVEGKEIRYIDWLVPGVIGMNMMFASLFGVGYVLVRYRKNGVLKRMKATPVSALNFVSAQAASRLLIVVLTSVAVYAGTNFFLGFTMKGSYLDLFLLMTLAVLSMISFGILFASRFRSEELAGGLLNLITFPMILLSGVFTSLDGSPELVKTAARALPLTHFIDGARSIMLDGAGLLQLGPSFLFLGLFTLVCLGGAALLFKWE